MSLITFAGAFWFLWLLFGLTLLLRWIAERVEKWMERDDIAALIEWEEEHWNK